ncbi:succinyl-coa synthetase beta chain, putative [Perkinsus marinus ATCC 50983]|uniref:Succinyl-coa synthetase beta chain, putative n=1 Tax=Perkinsus marinus (strain ATCC 50983 / TXsc) TaxID=423536 RepID=C5KCY6_PERM5|nr:succinyl-coa synthetase beta chain, putative [Perkinsus marinus ATCC 50983]EER17735.1 succinyl-coa synthetase beta chain, putative [Perkinsus marinus ATCC 50983]|eukprot:XP_002785939.1 succinyl-coa synthetase beta chain, putative [Perkinsus marinus ATCC 50983]
MVEINPRAEIKDGRVTVCDAKVNFDDNVQFRQKDIFSRRDASQGDPREVAAFEWDLNYIGLDGSIGCMVNGAGLAMLKDITISGVKDEAFAFNIFCESQRKSFELVRNMLSIHAVM